MAILAISRTIEAAHGTKAIHGHSFKIELGLSGRIVDDMVEGIDFHHVQKQFNIVLDSLDKRYLNDIIGRATVENIAIYIFKALSSVTQINYVEVWEGANQYVRVYHDDILQ